MLYKITLPIRMNREAKNLLGMEATHEQHAHLMVIGWDGKILSAILATQPTENQIKQVKDHALSLTQNVIGVDTNDYFDVEKFTIEPVTPGFFMDKILEFGRKYPRFDNGDDPNHSHLFRMYMHQSFDSAYSLIKRSSVSDMKRINLPFSQIPSDFDYKIPILLVSSVPLISHIFARELRLRYQKATRKSIKGIYVTSVSPYERLLDYASLFDPKTLDDHRNQIIMINFNVDEQHPLAVDLFDTYIIPRIIELAKVTPVILVSDNPFVYEHYKYVRMLSINLNERNDTKYE